ncbi:hypothetical protein EAH89_25215 [Roseomonas nepalensis]|uniref:Uncharacterized protein n=1 Tax=Muricoccus nepalensis TaxID=1854500 RepID=A0A502F9F6_9PROT|nr:hypothetical protein [Roseomonas nepalensis]TPG46032.1 hypothetical protein EAH89_25215 [Roseomonas nepalensis]
MSGRDRQRGRVYAWEDRVVAPHAPDLISFAAAQAMVDAIWAEMGLRWPPKVERLPCQASARQADATRLRLRLPEALPSWVLLHELAHCMTSTAEGGTDGHGPRFMGLYLQLLERYLRLPAASLLPSLQVARIAVDLAARPVFLDAPAP